MSLQDRLDELLPAVEEVPESRADHMRILLLDIETYPALTWQWSLWDKFTPVERIERPGGVLCWAAKWYGEPETMFSAYWSDGPELMARRMNTLRDEADAVVTYNGNKFDLPWLDTLDLEQGLPEPSPAASIDLINTTRRLKFLSKKLDYVCQRLDLGAKVQHEGFRMWIKAMPVELGGLGDPEAQAEMQAYNVGDVADTLEPLYDELLPRIKGHPHVALYAEDGKNRCQNCGHPDLELQDRTARTPLGEYRSYRCRRCLKWHRGKTRLSGVDARAVA